MKFSEADEASWKELEPYFDTCLVPFTGLTGKESPLEATAALERLRDFLDLVEVPFKGRVVTYPAFHYTKQGDLSTLNEICYNLKANGFKHVIVMSADVEMNSSQLPDSDLTLSLPVLQADKPGEIAIYVKDCIQAMWI